MRRDPTEAEEAFARALLRACDDASGEARLETRKQLSQPMLDALELVREVSTALLLGEPERLRDMVRKLDDLESVRRRVWWAVSMLEQRREVFGLDPWTMERAAELREGLAVHSWPSFAEVGVEVVHRVVKAWLDRGKPRRADAVVARLAQLARAYGWSYDGRSIRQIETLVRKSIEACRRREAEELATVARHQPNAASSCAEAVDDESAES
jgi:hypothetical protein